MEPHPVSELAGRTFTLRIVVAYGVRLLTANLTRPTRSAGALHEFSGSDMKMQVFGVLVHPDIRRNVATAELRVQLDGYLLHNPQRFVQQRLVLGRKVDQRGDVPLGHDYDVLSPMWPRATARRARYSLGRHTPDASKRRPIV